MASVPSLRLFLAIDLPPALRANIDQWRQRRHLPGRAELAPNMHITLVFLGQVAVDRIDSICDVAASTPFTAFDLTLDRIRLWRNGILHLAPSRAPAPLMELQQALNDGLGALGLWTERRRYSPHLTIARDVPEGRHGLPRCPKFQWHVDKLTLFSSERTDEGVLFYRPLAEWPAQAAPPQNTTPPSIPPSIDSHISRSAILQGQASGPSRFCGSGKWSHAMVSTLYVVAVPPKLPEGGSGARVGVGRPTTSGSLKAKDPNGPE